MKRAIESFVILTLFFVGCKDQDQLFIKLDNERSGIDFKNKLTQSEDFNIIDYLYFYNGGGVAIGDINGDGLPDLFFSGNQVKNKLYLNKGNLQFEDITEQAGVSGNSSWNTGSVMADVNGDGLLDIYVCAVVGLKNLGGHNELFINNGDNTFTERSKEFGLDFDSFSSSAVFLDYDLDGDLDIYLLNHAVHTPESFGHAKQRNVRKYETGDKLLRNDGNKFVDVSEEAGIYGGINGYGLGIAVADFNLDGYPDIYVGNDFHEDDYYYINNGDGTFREQLRESFTYSSRFSMGNDVADINHDGFPDLISLDMLPEDEVILKRSESDEGIHTLNMKVNQFGYYYQFERNMLQINQGNGRFIETGLMSNVAATDWSWSALFADYDQDGHQDVFISNGIPRRPNDLDYIKYVSSEQVVDIIGATKIVDEKAMSLMPSGKIQNYIYKGSGDFLFHNMSDQWLPAENTCSTATGLADLDNDGDLDIIVSNVDQPVSIYINQTNEKFNYLKIKLDYLNPNKYGIGTKLYVYSEGLMQYKEMYTVRGFQSSSEPVIHFGFGKRAKIDSLVVIWPNSEVQKYYDVSVNQTLEIEKKDNLAKFSYENLKKQAPLFLPIDPGQFGLDYTHTEDNYTDFDRTKLLPYQQSDRGPATAIGDINNDGLMDIFFGGSKRIASEIFIQNDSGFESAHFPIIRADSIKEDIEAVMDDFNNDGKTDLIIASGGADFYNDSPPLLDTYYVSSESDQLIRKDIPDYFENASCIRVSDFDGDGDKDVFIGNQSVSNDFGSMPKSYLLLNNGGTFTSIQQDLFHNIGMVTDAVWTDFNNDGAVDLIVVGEWMSPIFLKNDNGTFVKEERLSAPLNGLWQSITAFDIDKDGDQDYIIGNWGLNSKFRATEKYPMKMYYNDFDNNGKSETVIAIEKNGNYYPLDSYDVLAGQIISLHKKFTSYKDFAGKTIDEIFTKDQLKNSKLYSIQTLASGYLSNENGKFEFVAFDNHLQVAPIICQLKYDFDANGEDEVLLGGNYFGMKPLHGRYGSFEGALIKSDEDIILGVDLGLNLYNRSIRHFNIIPFNKENYLLVTINNGGVQLYKLHN
ncbi:hypothetical protein C900_02564 [Fulvivirga imtechensis AK7]|uniref:ASPIC/UnbV domain-containing protein n=1 Tax=Fulvivirga imtechensis AK7 TaxID=1237149 RepID=L8JR98_9BACT|nr:VCBS repeat-containing protein [Fulvivirga imtechensis]ELR71501.1 hypothetical protein C900_02564 [Fulvivirga imtechensis AK7]